MTPSLAIYLFGYKLDAILYPWRESVRSALFLADRVYFCACDDETFAEVSREFFLPILSDKLIVLRHDWGDHHSIQAVIANKVLDAIGTQFDFALKLDADEVLCEWSFDSFRRDLRFMLENNIQLGRPRYTHFCPDDRTTFPFIYDSKAVISRTTSGLRFLTGIGGDACALGGAAEYQTSLEVQHFGKMSMGREEEALKKEVDFTKLYTELGFPDPIVVEQAEKLGYIDYEKVFKDSKSKGEFQEYVKEHSIFVQEWLGNMRERSSKFWANKLSEFHA